MNDFRQAAIDAIKKRADKARDMVGSDHPFWEGLIVALEIVEKLPSAQLEQENEPVGCSGCRYDWFGDSRCNRCTRSFQDYYEADMRGEQNGQ